jgi:hypothetical protein
MLPDNVLHDLWASSVAALRRTRFIGINQRSFHRSLPDLPFGDEEVRSAAAFVRQQGAPARALRLQCGTVTDHILIVARTDDDLYEGQTAMIDGIAEIVGATIIVLDHN